jgi:hypothetical protein
MSLIRILDQPWKDISPQLQQHKSLNNSNTTVYLNIVKSVLHCNNLLDFFLQDNKEINT